MRTYGRLWFDDKSKCWIVKAEPHITIRMKRVFERISKTEFGQITLADSDETRRELDWFLQRYNLEVADKDWTRILDGTERYKEEILTLEKIIDPNWKPRREIKMALPPRQYQLQAAEVLLERKFLLLGDDLGLGKTCSAITCLTESRSLPAVVVTLAGVLPLQWQEEVNRFMPTLFTHIIKKRGLYELPKRDGRGPDVLIINYAKLDSWAEVLAKYVNCIILDECQELRHKGTAKYDAAVHVAKHAKFRLGLSGTPIFNYGGEIYNVLNVLKDGALGKYDEFFREWCTNAYGDKKISVRDPKALGTYLRENFLMLRRTRKDVGRELPPLSKIPHTVSVDMKALDDVKDSAFALAKLIASEQKISGFEKMKASEELSHMLRQATGIAKSPYVADFVRMLVEEGSSVVVYAWHRTVYEVMARKLEDLKPVMITGAESAKEKIAAKKKFVAGETKVLFISLRAGAGIDGLQKVCNTAVFAELDWSPGAIEQCIGRVFRDGQPDPVTAFFLVTEEGSDPTMSQALGLKTEQIEGLRNPDKELVETLQVDEERIRTLAKNYLAKNRAKMEAVPEEEEPQEAESEA
jgi:SNF2 family DNA or RNA helicase